jgi:hypothetical protein
MNLQTRRLTLALLLATATPLAQAEVPIFESSDFSIGFEGLLQADANWYDSDVADLDGDPGDGSDHDQGMRRSELVFKGKAPGAIDWVVGYDATGETRSIVIVDRDGNEVHRIVAPQGVYYGGPRWAPNDNRIAFHVSEQDRPHYAVYDIASAAFVAEAAVPKANPNIGGGCGGANMWRLEWRPDGGALAYSYGFGETGANGVWTWDLASGEQRVVPASFAGPATWGPGSTFIFEASGYLFLAGPAGGAPQLLTEGGSPVWWPGTE